MKNNYQSIQTFKPLIAALLVVFPPLVTYAATLGIPNSGEILQQIKPSNQATPSSSNTGLVIEKDVATKSPVDDQTKAGDIEKKKTGSTSTEPSFLINKLVFVGNLEIDTETLHNLVADSEGKKLTINELNKLAAKITDFYHSHGYPFALAIIPKQTVSNGVVSIEIMAEHAEKNNANNVQVSPKSLSDQDEVPKNSDITKYPMLQLTQPNVPFVVNTIRISGNIKVKTSILHGLVASNEGQTLTITELRERMATIADYYRQHGFPLAHAVIPDQLVKAGIVDVQIVIRSAKAEKGNARNAVNVQTSSKNTPYEDDVPKNRDISKYPMLQLTQPNVAFVVNAIRISGNIKVKTSILHALVAGNEAQTLTLIELRERIVIITDYYRKHGFPLAHAVIPGQLVKGGIVDVQIIKMHPTDDDAYDFSGVKQEPSTLVAIGNRLVSINNSRPTLRLMQPNTVFLVKSLLITGNIKVGTATLHALVAGSEGKRLNLIQLRERVGKITDYYKANGFPNAHAIIPGQVIKGGVVEVQVIAMHRKKDTKANASAAIAPIYIDAVSVEDAATIVAASVVEEKPQVATANAVADQDFLVSAIVISGNKNIATSILHPLVAEAEGKKLVIETLLKLVGRITDYYHSHGYPLARAIIPVQTISNGIVNVEVYEAYYGKLELNNSSRVKNLLLADTLSTLQPGDVIAQAKLDHALLLLSDIPGVVVNSTLKPGEAVGTSDLEVNTSPSRRVYGNVVLDNYGNSYTGRPRIGGTINVIDPIGLGLGDTLSLSALSSGSGLNYGRAAYESVLNKYGTRMGGSYANLGYKVGGIFKVANQQGSAQVLSIWAKHPLIRSRDLNLYGQAKLEYLNLNDDVGSTIKTDRNLNNGSFNITGDTRDAILSGGINTWDLGLTKGRVDFSNAEALLHDAVTTNTNGYFSKLNVNLSRLQRVSANNALYVSLATQVAGDNLDSSQKMTAGGPYTVRAYSTGAVSGDTGYMLSAELRHDLGSLFNGQVNALGFIDTAHITVNKNTWPSTFNSNINSATLSGIGFGINWLGTNNFNASAYIATPIGATPVPTPKDSTRVWVEIGKRF